MLHLARAHASDFDVVTHIGDGVDAREQADHADKGGENGVGRDADLDGLRRLGREQGERDMRAVFLLDMNNAPFVIDGVFISPSLIKGAYQSETGVIL